MDHFLTRLVARTLGSAPRIEPLIPSIYADAPGPGTGISGPIRDEKKDDFQDGLSMNEPSSPAVRLTGQPVFSSPDGMESVRFKGEMGPFTKKNHDPPEPGKYHLQPEARATSSDMGTAIRKPEYPENPAKAEPLPPHEVPKRVSSDFPTFTKSDENERFFPSPDQPPHRKSGSLAEVFQADGEKSENHSRPKTVREQTDMRQRPGPLSAQTAVQDLLVPTFSPHHSAFAPDDRGPGEDTGTSPFLFSGPGTSSRPVKVTIGRIEVRAVIPPGPLPATAGTAPKKPGPALSLEDYLKQRDGNRI